MGLIINPSSTNKIKFDSNINSNLSITGKVLSGNNMLFARPYLSNTLYMSLDDGQTWQDITYLTDNSLVCDQGRYIYVNPYNTNEIVGGWRQSAGTNSHILWSHDKGQTWNHQTSSGQTGDVYISETGQYIKHWQWDSPFQIRQSDTYGNSWYSYALNAPRGCMSANGQYVYSSVDNAPLKVSHDYGSTYLTTNSASMRSSVYCSEDGKYAIQGQYSAQGVQVSQDYGLTWTTKTGPGGTSSTTGYINSTGQYMGYVNGTQNNLPIWISQNYGSTFFNPLVNGSTNSSINRFAQEYCSDNGVIGAWSTNTGSLTKVWVSLDYGSTFTMIKDFSFDPNVTSIYQVGVPRSGTHVAVMTTTATGKSLYIASIMDLNTWTKVKDFVGIYALNYF